MNEDFIAARIYSLRQEKGVSAREMSLSIGQNHNYINQIELAKTKPSMDVFFYICEYFNITPKDFFDEENRYPHTLALLIENLKPLNIEVLGYISDIVKALNNR